MRRIFVVFIAAILLFNTVVFAEESVDYREQKILATFSLTPEFEGDSIVIKLSQLSESSALSFSYNSETGFLYADGGEYGIFIKELDENIEADENAITIGSDNGMQIAFPYRFKVFTYIYRKSEEIVSNHSIIDPRGYYEDKETVSAIAEATLELNSGKVQFVLQKLGTSSQIVDGANIKEVLKDNLLLVNKNNTLGREYIPSKLIYSKPSRGRTTVNLRLNEEAMLGLNNMLNAAYSESVSGMVITSAYRTFDKQTSLFNNKTNLLSRKMNRKTAMEEASKIVALPGSSEHQTGLAADICSDGTGLIRSFGDTRQGKWLEDNSWRYGFIIRYQKDKTDITGIIYEPWHVRYIGSGHPEIMKTKNLCLEEYVDYLRNNGVIHFKDNSGENYIVQYINKEDFNSRGMALSLRENSTWSISNCTKDSYVLTIKL